MAGERQNELFMGFAGFFGDRCYAFKNTAARKGFPYLNANVQQQMLLYHPKFRYPERAAKPPNWTEAMNIAPGVTVANPEPEDMRLDIVTPSGATVAIDDPELIEMLRAELSGENHLSLVRSDRALTDCRPVSLISMQSLQQLEEELQIPVDKRRFRANIYIKLTENSPFAEDGLVGRKLRLGSRGEVAVLERDPRCKMISIDPDTGEHNPEVFRKVAQAHEAFAGVYCAVLVEGMLSEGDSVEVVD